MLHIVMSAAMLVMAWPMGARLPTVGPMVFFMLAAAWYVAMVILADARPGRVANVYHVFMMSAMAWMYAVMNGGSCLDSLTQVRAATAGPCRE